VIVLGSRDLAGNRVNPGSRAGMGRRHEDVVA
jgi:hypothetical protein